VVPIDVVFYAENGIAPALSWLARQPNKVQDKFDFVIAQLEMQGHELRRPLSAPLERKIHELRVRWQRVNYRLLYFFDGRIAAVVAHGCTKEREVDSADIDRAVACREKYLANRPLHTLYQRSD
jgi:hypothetical protein